ncbi:MAG: 4-(cytidine 5'-diphospho)-2-C-methyl-D-erythritol kinase [Clostridia bacterium]|nr:4-(cytidine 5'-diphospho)-2-C-methyl-D-erythritol kinase [Clostridia bacterium]
MLTVNETANAKINLYLDVVSRREDGFHNIETLMQSVSLADTLVVSAELAQNTELELKIDEEGTSGGLSDGEDNLVCRAVRAYLRRAGIFAKVRILLKKRIPISAGLGGGSSDAAATLRGMNRIFGALTEGELLSLSSELGSDVPFCLVGEAAFCEGRGERMTFLYSNSPTPKLYYTLVAPFSAVSTPRAYAELDEIFDGFKQTRHGVRASDFDGFFEDISSGKTPKIPPYNVFELCPSSYTQSTKNAKERLKSEGAIFTLMSGSGSACFGIFATKNEAERAKFKLETDGFNAYFAESIG